jgi:2-aminoadipate transaminase
MTGYWSERYAQRIETLTSSTIRELLKLTQRPEVISFAGGLPASEFFPLERIEEATCRLLKENGPVAMQYSTTEGYYLLREMISRHVARYGIETGPENILITTGSQQALDLLAKLFLDRADPVLVEEPSYLGALQAFKVYGPKFMGLPLDDQGMVIDDLQRALERDPLFLYLLPNFHNPAGVTLDESRRWRIAELARKFKVPIVEDDPYGQLRYEGEHRPTVYSIDCELTDRAGEGECGNVIYLSSFSKVLSPGLRLGWVIAPEDVIGRLVQLKQGADLHTSTFCQHVAFEVAKGGFLDENIEKLCGVYRTRRDAMLNALGEYMPEEVTWTVPEGGLFLWVTLPEGVDSQELLEAALKENVAFVPGNAFYAQEGKGARNCRLNFSAARPEKIDEGIDRLAKAVKESMKLLTV